MDYTRDKRIVTEAEESGEPVICFRAQDRFAPDALRGYLQAIGTSREVDPDFLTAVTARLVEFEAWQSEHRPKVPDLRHDEPRDPELT